MPRRVHIAVIGDAGGNATPERLAAARDLGRLVADEGWRVVCGGLGGVMEAACQGAHESSRYGDGTTIGILPGYDPARANSWVDIPIATGLDFLRNAVVANADGVVAIGGGAGTLSEIAFAWMLQRPIVALRLGGTSGTLAGTPLDARTRVHDGEPDVIFGAADAPDAVRLLKHHLRRYAQRHGRLE